MNTKENYKFETTGYPKEMICWSPGEPKKKCLVLGTRITIAHPFLVIDEHGVVLTLKYAEDIPSAKPRTIMDGLKEGDVIVDKFTKEERFILGVCGKIIFISYDNNFKAVALVPHTLGELISKGYTLKKEKSNQQIVELTIQDISDGKGKGIDASLIRIKE